MMRVGGLAIGLVLFAPGASAWGYGDHNGDGTIDLRRNSMNGADIFVSYATADDVIVAQICEALEGQDLTVWVDSRELARPSEAS
jgi:hypothetical protein